MIRLLHLFILGTLGLTAFGQKDLAIGEWKALLPFNSGTYIAESPDRIFFVSDKALLRVTKPFEAPRLITTIDGLSDMDPNFALYNEEVNVLILTYENGNIDLIYEDEIININDIVRSTAIQGDKSINGIAQAGDKAFISTGFGIVVVDLQNGLILKSNTTPDPIQDFTTYQEHYVALMDGVLYQLPIENYNQFEFWAVWDELEDPSPLPVNIRHIELFNEELYFATDTELFNRNASGTIDTLDRFINNQQIIFLQNGPTHLMCGVRKFDGADQVYFYDLGGNFQFTSPPCHGEITHAWESKEGAYYFGDAFGGIRYALQADDCQTRFFECPAFAQSSDLDFAQGTLAIAGGGPSSSFDYGFSGNGFYLYKAPDWDNYNPSLSPEMRDPDIYDIFRIAVHPGNGTVYAGSYWAGLLKLENNELSLFDDTNSCLQGAIGDSQRERVSGLAFDNDNQLWVANYLAPEGLVVFRTDGSCDAFSIPSSSTLADLVCDDFNQIWARVEGPDAGLLVINENDPSTHADDRYKIFNAGNSALPNNEVASLCKDRSGNIWVGTTDGLVLFACGNSVFDFDCSTQPIVDDDGDGVGDFLLDDVKINAIIADGANRKWVGTDGGVIVLSPSGNEQLFKFTESNSPLFSNQITGFAQDLDKGIMYIGTADGVIAYRMEATGSRTFNSPNVYAYPNPVRPEYDGPIAIQGVAEDAIVKITDTQGRLLFETEALGGQAVWDGTQWNGERVASGVYLAWISGRGDFTRPSDAVVKIVVIR